MVYLRDVLQGVDVEVVALVHLYLELAVSAVGLLSHVLRLGLCMRVVVGELL